MIKVVALVIDEQKILLPLCRQDGINIEFVIVTNEYQLTEPYPDILITVSDWRYEIARILIEAKKLNIPTLLFQDGTLDWIIQYQGELYGGQGGATHFHPILADKIAVIGEQSARLISQWNSSSKVEVVGFPKMDEEIADALAYRADDIVKESKKRYTVLVTSPRQGWFCNEHQNAFVAALTDLKSYADTQNDLDVIWRLSRNLAGLIGVENSMKEKESAELVSLIRQCDFVISAQSTVVIEAMLYGKPVAIIDYLNSPQFYGTAWYISHRSQIALAINGMKRPEVPRMLFQEYQLNDVLYMRGEATSRAGELIHAMVKFKKLNPSEPFPANMLGFKHSFSDNNSGLSYKEVYPKVSEFKISEKEELQFLLSRANKELQRARKELRSRSLTAVLTAACRKLISNFRKN